MSVIADRRLGVSVIESDYYSKRKQMTQTLLCALLYSCDGGAIKGLIVSAWYMADLLAFVCDV